MATPQGLCALIHTGPDSWSASSNHPRRRCGCRGLCKRAQWARHDHRPVVFHPCWLGAPRLLSMGGTLLHYLSDGWPAVAGCRSGRGERFVLVRYCEKNSLRRGRRLLFLCKMILSVSAGLGGKFLVCDLNYSSSSKTHLDVFSKVLRTSLICSFPKYTTVKWTRPSWRTQTSLEAQIHKGRGIRWKHRRKKKTRITYRVSNSRKDLFSFIASLKNVFNSWKVNIYKDFFHLKA